MKNDVQFSGNRLMALVRKSVVFLYRCLLEPRSEDDDIKRREFILNLILAGIILLLLWSECFIIISHIQGRAVGSYAALGHFTVLCLYFFGLYVASRRGYIRLASYGLVTALLIGTLYTTWHWGASLPAGILSYALIITITSILISGRAGLIVAGIVVAAIGISGRDEILSGELPSWKRGSITVLDIIEYSLLFGVIAIVSWLSSREIEKSLHRARQSEQDLRAERDSLEIKVEERTVELRQAQAEKMSQLYRFAEFGRLSSGLFHDLANPLSAVVMNIGAISDSVHPEVPVVKEDLARAVKASERMAKLISAIKKQVGTSSELELFSVNETIEEVMTLFSHKSLNQNIALEFTANENVAITGNQIKLYQVITNLISNAFDSYDDSDTETANRIITLNVKRSDGQVVITVTDQGKGIAPEIMSHIFDPFFSTKPASLGMGLGLSTVQTVIEQDFGGTITAESSPHEKTVFTVTLPLLSS